MGVEISNVVTLTVPGYLGVEVQAMMPASFQDYLMMRRFARFAELSDDTFGEIDAALIEFGDAFLVSWNVDRGGVPVPATGRGLALLPAAFQLAVLTAWMRVARGGEPAAPLAEPSRNGVPSLAASETTGVS